MVDIVWAEYKPKTPDYFFGQGYVYQRGAYDGMLACLKMLYEEGLLDVGRAIETGERPTEKQFAPPKV